MNKEDDGGKGMQIVAVMVMAMAALTGAVSQEITSIQDEASQEEMEYQELFATARALEASENQILLREEILITEARSQEARITALNSEREAIEEMFSISEEEDFYTKVIKAEIDAYYIHGSDMLWMDWSEGMLIQSCYSELSTTLLNPKCRAEIVEFSGTDVVSDAVQISFTWDSQAGQDRLSIMASYLPLIADDYSGIWEPYIATCNYWTNCIQIQFPLFPLYDAGGDPTYESGWGAIWNNIGYKSYIPKLNQDISFTEGNLSWLTNQRFTSLTTRDVYLGNYQENLLKFDKWDQIGWVYDAVGDTENRDGAWAYADSFQPAIDTNWSLYLDWAIIVDQRTTEIQENNTDLENKKYDLNVESDFLAQKTGLLDNQISVVITETLAREELSQIDIQISIADDTRRELIAETLAYQLDFISLDDGDFSSSDSRTEFEDSIHHVSKSKYEEAKEVQEDALEIREGLESTTQSIMFVSGGNVLFGACGGMLREKRLGYKGGSDRNALMVFGAGILSSLAGLFLYLF
jgi:hypothetical protein